jgi:hypothetical protein
MDDERAAWVAERASCVALEGYDLKGRTSLMWAVHLRLRKTVRVLAERAMVARTSAGESCATLFDPEQRSIVYVRDGLKARRGSDVGLTAIQMADMERRAAFLVSIPDTEQILKMAAEQDMAPIRWPLGDTSRGSSTSSDNWAECRAHARVTAPLPELSAPIAASGRGRGRGRDRGRRAAVPVKRGRPRAARGAAAETAAAAAAGAGAARQTSDKTEAKGDDPALVPLRDAIHWRRSFYCPQVLAHIHSKLPSTIDPPLLQLIARYANISIAAP